MDQKRGPEPSRPLDLIAKAWVAFASDAASTPEISLRGGDALDGYSNAPALDPKFDAITDSYLEQYSGGLTFLDARSWRHYLPPLIDYSLRHLEHGSNVCEALLNNLRPPDREVPRLASLTPDQEKVVAEFLELLAFSEVSPYEDLACQVLEEWWVPRALYRVRGQ